MIDNYSEPTNFVKPKAKKKQAGRTTPILKNTDGKFIYGREESEAIMLMLYRAQDETRFKDYTIKLESDHIVDGEREVTVSFKKGA